MPDKAEDGTARVGAKEGVKLGRWLGRGVLRYGIEKELDGGKSCGLLAGSDKLEGQGKRRHEGCFRWGGWPGHAASFGRRLGKPKDEAGLAARVSDRGGPGRSAKGTAQAVPGP